MPRNCSESRFPEYRKIEIFCETHPENAAQLKKEYYTVKYLKTNVLCYFISCLACVIVIIFVAMSFS